MIGNNTSLHLTYQNIGTEPIDAEAQLTLDPVLWYVSATPLATGTNGQVVTWSLGTLQPGAIGQIHVTVHCDSTTAAGTTVLSTADLVLVQRTSIRHRTTMN